MKKIMNDPRGYVDQTLAAFAAAHADKVRLDREYRVCHRAAAAPPSHVALVSGGGSGHEPLHAGFVGEGMLTAAVAGDVFASPNSEQVYQGARAAAQDGGVLLIIKNYTGDVLNFRIAAELLEDDDIPVEIVIVAEDAAMPRGEGAGRRGTAGTLLVEKIAGALAAEGADLASVRDVAQRVADASRSIAFALESCTTPMAGRPTFGLPDDQIEFGVGIHGERGREARAFAAASDLAEQMVDALCADMFPDGAPAQPFLAFTNGLGGTPPSELYLLHGDILSALERRGIQVGRHLVGTYVTSLDMAGASLTLLPLDDELMRLWDAPVRTPALVWG